MGWPSKHVRDKGGKEMYLEKIVDEREGNFDELLIAAALRS